MPLQNRVTPFGDIEAFAGRGTIMGNRGVLHDERRRIVRYAQVRRWIACRLEFRGRHRAIMQPRRWTELFFLDEAAAFAAGHRPCAECRNREYKRFRALWEIEHGGPTGADAIDRVLDAERRDGRRKRTHRAPLDALPDGTFVALEGRAWLVLGGELLPWTDRGYGERRVRQHAGEVDVLTAPSIVALIRAGYRPELHPSAEKGRQ
jgi:hypothetical protein